MSEPAASHQLDTNATVTTIPVRAKRTVTYEFDTSATNVDLAIPYVVIVDGKVQAPDKPRRLSRENRKIKVTVDTGSKVALYLNSDVHPSHRRNPVYEVTVAERNVAIKVNEKTGIHRNLQPIIERTVTNTAVVVGTPAVDSYTAPLTGDIWMSIVELH
jgi:hypothetical protein